jgi:DNA polymerase III sliding clamp (beta) subunit (PCNA family)
MRATASASDLLSCISTAALVTPRLSERPGHTGVLLEIVAGQLSATGTDGDTAIVSRTPVAGGEPGEIVLPPKPLTSYLSTLPGDTTVTLRRLDTDELEVAAEGRSTYRFRPITASFTRPGGLRLETRPAGLGALGSALKVIGHAVSRDHGGIQLVSSDDGLVLNATDNYRLAHARIPGAGFGTLTVVVAAQLLELVSRLELTSVAVDAKGTVIRFASPRVSVIAKLLAVPFPPTESLLSARGAAHITLPVGALRAALRPLEAVAGTRPLTVDIAGDSVTLAAANVEVGTGSEQIRCPAATSAPAFRFAVSAGYLRDAVAAADSAGAATATLWWGTPDSALYLTVTDPVAATMVIMPQTLT